MSNRATLYHGDCRDVLPTLAPVDAVVCDPPYGLSFMGKGWDHGVPGEEFWAAVLGAAKPGAHLLAFGGTRTFHRLACAIEDAGWEIRDTVMWVYGSGFPKSLDVSKAIDKAAGALKPEGKAFTVAGYSHAPDKLLHTAPSRGYIPPAPATDAARQWQGWGTALKPAWEPIIVARKPLDGTVAANVLAHGTGALNVDGCRVAVNPDIDAPQIRTMKRGRRTRDTGGQTWGLSKVSGDEPQVVRPEGRWPANLIHDGSDEVLDLFPETRAGVAVRHRSGGKNCHSEATKPPMDDMGYGDSGSAARFFYCAKASKSDRGAGNTHPTVKPLALMRYLCRLVTPPGGVILDPFMGSGSTGKAALMEGFRFIGIEREADYLPIARARLAAHD